MTMLSAVIVGAGFSGLAAGIALRRAGITDFAILEQAGGVGGTWRENTYPGAACDIPSHLYSYSFEPNPRWTHAYGGQPEILAYLEHCATRYGLRAHLRFGARVVRAAYDDPSATWIVETAAGDRLAARALILGNGALHVPALPALPGRESFAGAAFHTARWDHRRELAGARVAVIGTGASAIQVVPQLARQVGHLAVFQRTPPWIMPKTDRAIAERERWILARVPGAHWLRRTGLYWRMESRILAFAFSPRVGRLAEQLARDHLERSVSDPGLRARLTPNYRVGCKRVLISSDYYPALQRPNVELVTSAIAGLEPAGVRTADGRLHEVDTIVYGTGFRVVDYLSAIEVIGRDGRDLNAEWRASVRSYLGISVSGFPNLFLLMGPNTGLGHNSMVFMIEAQARYAAAAIHQMQRRGLAELDVRPERERAFRAELQRKLAGTVWTSGCSSWYQAPDGEVLLWPSFTFEYWLRTRRVELAAYTARPLSRASAAPAAGPARART
jgi:cation diffusion facilitator CzcD-associated flavoprotein CzcO